MKYGLRPREFLEGQPEGTPEGFRVLENTLVQERVNLLYIYHF